jgi:hypothetical protein
VNRTINELFLLKTVLRQPASKVIYTSTEDKNFDDIKRFLGQANFDQQITVAEYVHRCCL